MQISVDRNLFCEDSRGAGSGEWRRNLKEENKIKNDFVEIIGNISPTYGILLAYLTQNQPN